MKKTISKPKFRYITNEEHFEIESQRRVLWLYIYGLINQDKLDIKALSLAQDNMEVINYMQRPDAWVEVFE